MAEEKKKVAAGGSGANKLMLIVIMLLVVLIAAVGGLGAYMFLHQPAANADAAHNAAPAPKRPEGPPIFEKMEPFVVNLTGGEALLQVEMQVQLIDAEAKQTLIQYMPKIRSGLILLLSSKTADELATPDGKVRLKAQVKKIMNESIELPGQEPVDSVLFTSFIIQNQ